jgi:flagellar hook-associated protein 1 FlgK
VLTPSVLGGTGQGVAVNGVMRQVDRTLLAERRLAQAGDGDRSIRSGFLEQVERTLGSPDEPGSIAARLAAFDQALIEAQGRPESQTRLEAVLAKAKSLTQGFNKATEDIQAARGTADRQIADEVGRLNTTLVRLQGLNAEMRSFSGAGRDVSALLDERQRLVDSISSIVPVREVDRGNGQIALFSVGGVSLLEGNAAVFGFTPVHAVTAEMTQALGGLSGITINGQPYATAGAASPILGGKLGALFALRDEIAVGAQGKVDAVARDLVERFSTAGLDPTLLPDEPGLFTDGGGAFLPADEIGLAGRLSVNPAADPAQGGAVYRIRDGLGALAEGPPGNGALLGDLRSALTATNPLSSPGFTAGMRSFAALTAALHADASIQRLSAQADQSFAASRLTTLNDLEAQNGIDTDQEMQELLVIERNYSANAKVIQSVKEMIDILMSLG